MKKLLLSLLAFLPLFIFAQVPDIRWEITEGGEGDDVANDIIKTSDGGFAVCGFTDSEGMGGKDVIVIKLDAKGKIEWKKTFGDKIDEEAFAIIQTKDNGFAVCGYLHGPKKGKGLKKWKGKKDFYLVKMDSKGKLEWEGIYGGTKDDIAYDLVETYDGNIAMVGATKSRGAGSWSIWVVKVDSKGNRLWRKTQGGQNMDIGKSIIEHPKDSSLIVCGTTFNEAVGQSDMWLIKLTKDGKKVWRKKYGDEGRDFGDKVILKSTGEYIMVGRQMKKSDRYSDYWVVGFTKESWDDWYNVYGTVKDEGATDLDETPDNGVVTCGYTNSYGEGNYDMWIMKFDEEGKQVYEVTFGGLDNDQANGIVAVDNNEFVVCGFTKSDGDGKKDIWITYLK